MVKGRQIGLSTSARRPGEELGSFLAHGASLGFPTCLLEEEPRVLSFAGGEVVAAACRAARVRLAGLALLEPGEDARPPSLVAPEEAERLRAVRRALGLGRLAASAGAALLVLHLGRSPEPLPGNALQSPDAVLERLCRSLHELTREHPDLTVCLTPPRQEGWLPCPADLAAIRAELPRRRLAFWHDTAEAALAAHRGGAPDPEDWLHHAVGNLAGLTLGDTDGQRTGLPPGSGLARLQGLDQALERQTHIVLGLGADLPREGLPAAREAALQLLGG